MIRALISYAQFNHLMRNKLVAQNGMLLHIRIQRSSSCFQLNLIQENKSLICNCTLRAHECPIV